MARKTVRRSISQFVVFALFLAAVNSVLLPTAFSFAVTRGQTPTSWPKRLGVSVRTQAFGEADRDFDLPELDITDDMSLQAACFVSFAVGTWMIPIIKGFTLGTVMGFSCYFFGKGYVADYLKTREDMEGLAAFAQSVGETATGMGGSLLKTYNMLGTTLKESIEEY